MFKYVVVPDVCVSVLFFVINNTPLGTKPPVALVLDITIPKSPLNDNVPNVPDTLCGYIKKL